MHYLKTFVDTDQQMFLIPIYNDYTLEVSTTCSMLSEWTGSHLINI